ncbi:hypothetical protein ACH4C6_35210, partial [Streptomyces sp. NPDC017943]|uniref:hypothetical protein n=1 Tax=Streptomyces sp. NPDC017943 TaxID=3365019 RepID=UPI003794FF83
NWDITYGQVHHYASTQGVNLTAHDLNDLRTHTAQAQKQANVHAQAPAEATLDEGAGARRRILRTDEEWADAIRRLPREHIFDEHDNPRLPPNNVMVGEVPIGMRLYGAAHRRGNGKPYAHLSDEEAKALRTMGLEGFLVKVDRGWVLDEGVDARRPHVSHTSGEWAAAIRGLLEKDITDSDKNYRLPPSTTLVHGVCIGQRLYHAACRQGNGKPHTILSDEEAEALQAMKLGGFLVQVDGGWVLAEGADARRRHRQRTSEEWAAAIRGLPEENITDRYRKRCLPSQTVKVGGVPIGKHLSDAARRTEDGQPHALLSDEEAKALRAKDLERFLVKVNGKWALDKKPVQPDAGPSRQAVEPSPARYNTRARAVIPTGNTARPGTKTTAPLPQPPIGRHTAVSTSHSHHPMPLTVAAAAGQTPPGTAHPHSHHPTNQQPSPQRAGLTRNPHTTPNRGLGR